MLMAASRVTGHVFLAKRKRGDRWYAKYRLPDGRQVQKVLGPAWAERGRPPEGVTTRARPPRASCGGLMTDAERGTLAAARKTGATFADVAV